MQTYATVVTLLLIFVFFRSLYVLGRKEEIFNAVVSEATYEIEKRESQIQHLIQKLNERK